MQQSYWNKVLERRVSRRRAIAATGLTAAAAAFLAACGGGDDDSGGDGDAASRDSSGLLSPIVDTSKQAKAGGKYVYPARREPLHFDGKAQGQVQLNVFMDLPTRHW